MPSPSISPPSVQHVAIDTDQAGQRIDNFLLAYLKGVPKSRVYRVLRKGEVRVNRGRVKPEYKLVAGDQVRIPPIRLPERRPAPVPGSHLLALLENAILYQDDDLIALNKPAGIAVHGGSGVNLGAIEILRKLFDNARLELVHRIDRETSGCLLVAKRRPVLRHLQAQFREKTVEKHYHTLVAGKWPRHCREINAPLLKNQLLGGERVVRVDADGKPSVTGFRVLERFAGATLMEASPLTGRTHQIRVHALSAGHPILGDDKYGNDDANKTARALGLGRLFLHAAAVRFTGTDGQAMSLTAPLPEELEQVLAAFRHQ